MANLIVQLQEYRLTTAHILYHMPDHPKLLQSFLWQEYDLCPDYPNLIRFLHFWQREIEGKLHSVSVGNRPLISAAEIGAHKFEYLIH